MLRTRIPRLLRPTRCAARSLSTVGYEDMPNLRVFPFSKTPEEAQRHLAIMACTLHFAKPRNLLSSLLAAMTESSYFSYIRPTKFSAAYFPAWIINGEISVDISYKGAQLNASSVFFKQTYIPGSHMPVISAAPLWIEALEEMESVPFSPSLLHQHGEDVQCIPFSVSPFSVVDALESSDSLRVDSDLSFSPNSIKSGFFSASPVLIPVYMARYEDDGSGMTGRTLPPVAMITGGLSDTWATIVEGAAFQSDGVGKAMKKLLLNHSDGIREAELLMEEATSRVNGRVPVLQLRAYETDQIFEELDEQLNSSANIARLASARNLVDDLSDPRIREHTAEEVASVETYLDCRLKVVELGFVTSALGDVDRSEGARFAAVRINEAMESLKEKELTPKWWIEYQASFKSKDK